MLAQAGVTGVRIRRSARLVRAQFLQFYLALITVVTVAAARGVAAALAECPVLATERPFVRIVDAARASFVDPVVPTQANGQSFDVNQKHINGMNEYRL